jgi:hypothetical protein
MRRFSVRPSLLVDQTIDIVTHHPLSAIGLAAVAIAVSWLITRTRVSV